MDSNKERIDRNLAIDIETFCELDLSKVGVYAYSHSPSFEILLFAYAFDDDDVKVVDLARGEKLPDEVVTALFDENIIKTAFNANFERVCISTYLNTNLSPKSWSCTAVQGAAATLPPSLEKVGEVLNLENKKLKEGKDLIKYFSLPVKPMETNNYRSRNLPHHDLDKWELFKKYCIRDVVVERKIRNKLKNFHLNREEKEVYILDQEINDRGILVDEDLVNHAIECDKRFKEKITNRAFQLTKLNNPNSPAQLKKWLLNHNVLVENINKKSVKELLDIYKAEKIKEIEEVNDAEEVIEVLELRLLMSKTSTKKYEAIKKSICNDNRVRGLFKFYGASRSGRWAGRLVQVQNLPKNYISDLDLARDLLKKGKYEEIELLYESTPEILSQLIRSAFIPKKGYEFIVADFSAIEARVLAWISDEKWRLKVFESHGKIYEASAANMFRVPMEKISKDSQLRQKGKIAELALGYGGSVGALTTMGALDMGLDEKELLPLVNKFRQSNSNITKFWWDVHRAAITTVRNGTFVSLNKIDFNYKDKYLFITLPSKRRLSYINPRLQRSKFNSESLVYEGMGSNKKWGLIETYGPKLVENIVQAISRDILCHAMINLRNRGFDIVMHVHDEVVLEVKKDSHTVEEVCEIMGISPCWAKDLPLRAEGYKCNYYVKA